LRDFGRDSVQESAKNACTFRGWDTQETAAPRV